ncbi:MAG: DNA-processing protein DprA [Vicinamibacterales bacterium]
MEARLELVTGLSLLAGSGDTPHRSQLGIAVREAFDSGDHALVTRLAALWRQDPPALRARLEAVRPEVKAAIAQGLRAGLAPILWADAHYPARLARIYDPPPLVWCRGDPARLDGLSVALVGARAASSYARDVAERLGEGLARRGVTVVSGLARGVDGASHRGSLAGGGPTIAVLGSGADVVYPAEHLDLADAIARNGAVVSELLPGARPLPEHFPLRNRIISGLSVAVVIVEASEKSGSLITARMALEQGREVMAVPGNVLSPRNRGSHALLRDGAKLVEGVDDILEELGASARLAPPADAAKQLTDEPLLSLMEDGEDYAVEDLEALTGLRATALLTRLLELEMNGQVARREAGRFVRVRKGC